MTQSECGYSHLGRHWRRALGALTAGLMTLVSPQAGAAIIEVDFDDMAAEAPPEGFAVALTGEGGPPLWVVRDSDGGRVLAQTSDERKRYRFPLCVYQDVSARDVEASVRFLTVSGQIDRAAGLVWRYQDADNYYVVRANALESNVVLYKVENGKRSDLKPVGMPADAYGVKAPVRTDGWNTLRITARGALFRVWLNGERLFDVEDETFQSEGKVGLWTKADSVTLFDDFEIETE